MARFTLKGATIAGLGQVVSGNIDFGATNLVDTTTVTDERKLNLPGTMEPLSFDATVQWDPTNAAGQATAMAAYLNKTKVTGATITWPDTGTASVSSDGYWTNVTAPISVDGAMQATFSFKGTGAPTFTP